MIVILVWISLIDYRSIIVGSAAGVLCSQRHGQHFGVSVQYYRRGPDPGEQPFTLNTQRCQLLYCSPQWKGERHL